jgi:hypothetical protein
MKKYTIAELLHYAADKNLASKDSERWNYNDDKEKFSCCAVHQASWQLYRDNCITDHERHDLVSRCFQGLNAMGCPTDSVDAFNDNGKFIEENQQARYSWLKFAAIIAEEQGV